MGGVPVVQLSTLIRCRRHHAHSCPESPSGNGLVCRNPSGNYHLPPSGRSWSGQSVLCRLSLVRIYRLFCCCHRHAHSCRESPVRNGCVGHSPSGHYHLRPDGRSGLELSVLSTNFLSFLSLSLSHSWLPGSVILVY